MVSQAPSVESRVSARGSDQESMDMLESFEHVVDSGSDSHVPHEYILQEVNQVDIVIYFVQLFLGDQWLRLLSQAHVEFKVFLGVETDVASEQLVEETAKTPHI